MNEPLGFWSVVFVMFIVSWIALPFTVSGGVSKLRKMIELQKETNQSLERIEALLSQSVDISLAPKSPNGTLTVPMTTFEAMNQMIKLIKRGGLSVAGLALKLNKSENEVYDQCQELYKLGRISQSELDSVLMRKADG